MPSGTITYIHHWLSVVTVQHSLRDVCSSFKPVLGIALNAGREISIEAHIDSGSMSGDYNIFISIHQRCNFDHPLACGQYTIDVTIVDEKC